MEPYSPKFGDQDIPALKWEDTYRYLGVQVGGNDHGLWIACSREIIDTVDKILQSGSLIGRSWMLSTPLPCPRPCTTSAHPSSTEPEEDHIIPFKVALLEQVDYLRQEKPSLFSKIWSVKSELGYKILPYHSILF